MRNCQSFVGMEHLKSFLLSLTTQDTLTQRRKVLSGNLMTTECNYVRVCCLLFLALTIIQQKAEKVWLQVNNLSVIRKNYTIFYPCYLNHFCVQPQVAEGQINKLLIQFAEMRRQFSIVSFSTNTPQGWGSTTTLTNANGTRDLN